MKAYLPKSFQRQARNERVSDEDCREAIRKAERGLIDAILGGQLIKQRIPMGDRGAGERVASDCLLQAWRIRDFPAHLRQKPKGQPEQV
jgi:RelE toxin of RelE / RelB toxin-antitoxin system